MDSQFPDKIEENTCINEIASRQVQLFQITQDHVKPFIQMDQYYAIERERGQTRCQRLLHE
jgi:hypothetical protein